MLKILLSNLGILNLKLSSALKGFASEPGLMHGSILPVTIPPPPRQPRGQVQPFGRWGGKLFEAVLSRGEGGGANRK